MNGNNRAASKEAKNMSYTPRRGAMLMAIALSACLVLSYARNTSAGQATDPLDSHNDAAGSGINDIIRELIADFAPPEEKPKELPKGKTEAKKRPFFGMEGRDVQVEAERDPKEAVRKLVAYRSAAIPALKEALLDKRPQVRYYAAQTLSLIKGKQAAMALLPILRDEKELAVTRVFAARAAGYEDLDEAIPDLLAAAKSSSPELRVTSLESMSVMTRGWERCADAFVEAVSDESPAVRKTAIVALGERKCRKALPRLREVLLKDESEEIRANAAIALYRIRSAAAVPDLIKAMDDKSEKVRKNSMAALRLLAGSFASDPEGWKKWWEEKGKNMTWEDAEPLKEAIGTAPAMSGDKPAAAPAYGDSKK